MVAFLALRSLRRSPTRTLLLLSGITLSGSLLFDMTMLGSGLVESFSGVLGRLGYEIRVVPRGTLPLSSTLLIPNASRITAALATHPDVAWVSPIIATQLYVEAGGKRLSAVAYGIPSRLPALVRTEADVREGIVINPSLARELRIRAGDRVRLGTRLSPSTLAPQATVEVRVAGFGEFPFDLRGQRTLASSLRTLEELLGTRDSASFLAVKVREGEDPEAVRAWMNRSFPELEALSIPALLQAVRRQLRYFDHFSVILSGVSLVVATLLVGTVLTLQLGERLGELAVLRTLGVQRTRLVLLVLLEGFVLAATSAPLALGIGLALSEPLDAILRAMPGVPQDVRFFVPSSAAALRTVLLLLATGTLGAAYPAWVAGSLELATTLHREVQG
ncbi:MAG: FtsX-like permease family protein [Armatimonadota bacterium]|nr:FtsX-like permease family protein [Armatimonadota bacterium]MDR7439679.1 FtsX-like permease family protein [Armatimonadota bacterium]MDR7562252.1 FtsX-like permease family protein [Armatimonadota bacterium]MDR7568795.1 FtsX-like permease family protein [Armatimonadota bacterium]MDR7602739.1 FtsX-like permease family protein [Armatimonadota bacterium]